MADEFFDRQPHSKQLPAGDPHRALAEEAAWMFTTIVDALRQETSMPNPVINGLMGLVWDLVGSKTVPTALVADIHDRLHFSLARSGSGMREGELVIDSVAGENHGFVAVPHEWPGLVRKNPVLQSGAVVWIGSQVVDFFNGRIPHKDGVAALWAGPDADTVFRVEARAKAYEAEFLHTVRKLEPTWTPTTYQKRVCKEFPEGVQSRRAVDEGLVYVSRPFN